MYGYKCEYCDGIVQERVVEEKHLSTDTALSFWRMCPLVCATSVATATTTQLCCIELKRLLQRRNCRSEWNWFLSLLLREEALRAYLVEMLAQGKPLPVERKLVDTVVISLA